MTETTVVEESMHILKMTPHTSFRTTLTLKMSYCGFIYYHKLNQEQSVWHTDLLSNIILMS